MPEEPKETELTKRDLIIAAFEEDPSTDVQTLARTLGCTSAHVYAVRKKLLGSKREKKVTKREKIIRAFELDPYASSKVVAKYAKCSPAYVRTVRRQHQDFLEQQVRADEFVDGLLEGQPWSYESKPEGNAVSALRYAGPLAVFLWAITLAVVTGVYVLWS